MTKNEALIRRWFEEVWNKNREEAIDEMLAEGCIHYGLGGNEGGVIKGPVEFKQFYKGFINAFPDIHVTVEDCISKGNKIAVRCTVRATHTGDSLGFKARGEQVEFTGIGFCRIEGGKFAEVWNEFDFMSMYRRLGVVSFDFS